MAHCFIFLVLTLWRGAQMKPVMSRNKGCLYKINMTPRSISRCVMVVSLCAAIVILTVCLHWTPSVLPYTEQTNSYGYVGKSKLDYKIQDRRTEGKCIDSKQYLEIYLVQWCTEDMHLSTVAYQACSPGV